MKDTLMGFFAAVFVLLIIAAIAGFVAIVFVDRHERMQPVLPNAYDDLTDPDGQYDPPRVYDHDVKG